MNSWKSSSFGACIPPLTTLKWGTGSRGALSATRLRHSGWPVAAATARAAAIDTPTMALAPSRDLFSVPSRSISIRSSSARSANARELTASAISPFRLATARNTPFPPNRAGSPSRSSTASLDPVEAPDGTPARAIVPSPSATVTVRVGRPRESRISRACTAVTSTFMGLASWSRSLIQSCRGSTLAPSPVTGVRTPGTTRRPARTVIGEVSEEPSDADEQHEPRCWRYLRQRPMAALDCLRGRAPLGLGLPALRTVRGLKNGVEGTFELDAHGLLDPAPCRVESSRKVSSRSAGVLVELGRLGPGRGRAPGRRGVAAGPAALQAADGCEVALDTRPPKRVSWGSLV